MQKEIIKALLEAKKKFKTITKEDLNPFFKSKYAGLPSVLEAVTPTLAEHDLVVVQSPISEGDRIGVETTIYHVSGESITSKFTMNLAKNDPQGAGSAITYARRYSLVSMLGLNVDDDDDGNVASNKSTAKVAYSPKINNVQEDIEL